MSRGQTTGDGIARCATVRAEGLRARVLSRRALRYAAGANAAEDIPSHVRAGSALKCSPSQSSGLAGPHAAKALALEMVRATPPASSSVLQARFEAEAAAEAKAAAAAASAAEQASCAGDDDAACCSASCWGEWDADAGDGEIGDDCGDDCGVCLDSAADVRLEPCGHTLCAECCGQLFGMQHAEVVACPFCRGAVGAFRPACC
jgi:hypothetical protein